MTLSLQRIYAMFLRYLYLHKRSVSRTLEIIFWPVMELFVWGFLTVYLKSLPQSGAGQAVLYLIGAMIFWDVLYRSQQGVSISFVEDIWTQNISNLFISPLRIWEWIVATFLYSTIKISLIVSLLSVIALLLYDFDLVGSLGLSLVPLVSQLFIFGWAMGIMTAGLLIRWGHSVEALIWGIPFLLQPLSAIFYPLSVLPVWVQKVAIYLPSTHVFEGMRQVLLHQVFPTHHLMWAVGLNVIFMIGASLFFQWMYQQSRLTGKLGRLGTD